NWTPSFVQSGPYNIVFRATDGVAVDTEIVTITVNDAGNRPPDLALIGPRSTTEGVNLNFNVSATNVDGPVPTLTTSTLPSGATFINNGNGTGTFNWTPTFTQAGNYFVFFYATDDSLSKDSEIVSITVNEAGNQEPVLAPIGARSTTENVQLAFGVSATDPDGTIPTLSTSALPTGANFVNNGNGTGNFTWTPTFTQAGTYNVKFYASDGARTDSENVTITVNEAGNQAPVLAAIGAKSTTEGVLLTFGTSAADPDGTTPVLSTSTLPIGATFINNGNGTGTFNWTPSFVQSGSYNIRFYASDGSLVDSEIVAITVNEAGNQRPVLATIGSKSTTENVNLSFVINASDPDGTTPSISRGAIPTGASFVDNGNGTANFNWTPTFTQAGVYNVLFWTSDGTLNDSEIVQITVIEAGNQIPVLAAIGAKSVTEGALLSFNVSATDVDGTIPSFTTSTLPTGATFIDNGNGTGTFNWTPTFTQSGLYNVTFRANDGLATDTEIVVITVNDGGNRLPVLASIGAKSVTEGGTLNFGVSATNADGPPPVLTTSTRPPGATFVDNGNGTGTFNWVPNFTQNGIYAIRFFATDDSLAVDTELVNITVTEAGNQRPVLAPIGPRSTNENVLLTFIASATDPDGTTPSMTAVNLPTGASYVNNGNGTGTFNWTPTFAQSGSYFVTFISSDGILADSETVPITVNELGNQAPVLAAIGAKNRNEGLNLNFVVTATDADGSTPTLSTSALPSGASFVDNLNGSGTFNWTPGFTQAGIYNVVFRASDGSLVDTEIVVITINEAGNQAPVLATIGAKSVTEGVLLTFNGTATDPDGTTPTLSANTLPTGASFVNNGNGTGTFNWTPNFTQSGVYNVRVMASDGILVDTEIVTVTVTEAGNQAPVLALIGPRSTTEGVNLNFVVSATDPDGTTPTITTSTLPTGATFTPNGGNGTFNWTPTFVQAGSYAVTFRASDGPLRDSEIVIITVNEAGNQAPILATIGPRATTEGVLLSFAVSSTDPDGTIPNLTTSTLPTGATFINNGNGTGSFNWTPTFTQAGNYPIRFYASDAAATDSEVVIITVNEAGNQRPVMATVGNKTTTEGVNLNFGISATDVDGTTPVLTSSTLPTGATFIDNGNGTGTFNWTPSFTQSGTYNNIRFFASDGQLVDTELISINVTEAGNQPPVLATIGSKVTNENVNLNFDISATDPDGVIPSFTTSTLPSGATFVNNGNGTGTFNWTPTFTQAGLYNIVFRASDGAAVDTEVVQISVIEAGNQEPVLAAIGAKSTTENVNLTFGISAVDPDGTIPNLTTSTLPTGATFVNNGNGTGSFNWTPTFTQSGTYNITFRATDGLATDTERITITVLEAGNQFPVLAAIGNKSVTEGQLLTFNLSATDPDGNFPNFTSTTLPTGSSLIDNLNGTATLTWTPDFTQSGSYNVRFRATDGALVDTEIVIITVNEAGNQAPVLATIGNRSTTEGVNLNFNISATDADGTTPNFTNSTLPSGATLVNNGNGTATFN
ncbi:MAG: beta strand repeat-containing protein, partial [Candidatus Zixiibacteriota bacterium]